MPVTRGGGPAVLVGDAAPAPDGDRAFRPRVVDVVGRDIGFQNRAPMQPAVSEVELVLEELALCSGGDLRARRVPDASVLVGDSDFRPILEPERIEVAEVPTREARVDRVGELSKCVVR